MNVAITLIREAKEGHGLVKGRPVGAYRTVPLRKFKKIYQKIENQRNSGIERICALSMTPIPEDLPLALVGLLGGLSD